MRNLLICLVMAAVLGACSPASDNVISVSIEPQKALLAEIVGDKYEVNVVLPAGENPETFDPKMQQRKMLAESKVWFTLGSLPFESVLAKNAGDLKIVDTSKGISLISGTHEFTDGDGHHHDSDPHIWMSPANMRVMVGNMASALEEISPENSEFFRANAEKLEARLDSLSRSIAVRLEPVKGEAFVVWHPSLTYFARDYDLHQLSVGFENKEISPKQLLEFIEDARSHNPHVFFAQPEDEERRVATVANPLKLRVVDINPMSADYEKQFNIITDALLER